MTGERKNIDNLFRDGLNGYRQRAPVHAWNRLEQSLDHAQSRRRTLFLRLAAASILILMAFGAGYFYATYMKQPADVANKELPNDRQAPVQQEDLTGGVDPDQPQQTPAREIEQESPTGIIDTRQEAADRTLQANVAHPRDVAEPSAHESSAGIPMMSAGREEVQPVSAMASLNPASISLSRHTKQPGVFASFQKKPVNLESLQYYPEDYDLGNERRNANWAVGAQFAPIYSYREISANYGADLSGARQDVVDLNDVEEGLLSYSGGVDVGYNFSKRWSMQSGVYFSRIGQVNTDALEFRRSKDEFLLYSITTSTGDINVAFDRVPQNVRKFNAPKDSIGGGALTDVRVIQNFDLFEVPLVIRYKFLDRKFSMNLSGGLSPAYLLANNTYLELESNRYDVGDAGNLNSMIVNTSLGMGFAYSVTRTLSLNFEPTFKYALNPINNNSNISYHPYSFTWFTGIRLRID